MDVLKKELESRRKSIAKEVALLFKANMKITDWDVPETEDNDAAKLLIQIIKEEVVKIEADIEAGKYEDY